MPRYEENLILDNKEFPRIGNLTPVLRPSRLAVTGYGQASPEGEGRTRSVRDEVKSERIPHH